MKLLSTNKLKGKEVFLSNKKNPNIFLILPFFPLLSAIPTISIVSLQFLKKYMNLKYFFDFSIWKTEGEGRKEREEERANQAEAISLELYPGLPHACEGPKHLDHLSVAFSGPLIGSSIGKGPASARTITFI